MAASLGVPFSLFISKATRHFAKSIFIFEYFSSFWSKESKPTEIVSSSKPAKGRSPPSSLTPTKISRFFRYSTKLTPSEVFCSTVSSNRIIPLK